MDLVKPTGYEKLMSQIELERKKFKSVFEATLNAVLDILYAYGYIQYNLFCPGRPMSLQEFLVLNKGGYTFFRCTENVFTRWMKKLVAFSWNSFRYYQFFKMCKVVAVLHYRVLFSCWGRAKF